MFLGVIARFSLLFQITDGRNVVYRTFRVSITDVDNKKPVLTIHRLSIYLSMYLCIYL